MIAVLAVHHSFVNRKVDSESCGHTQLIDGDSCVFCEENYLLESIDSDETELVIGGIRDAFARRKGGSQEWAVV